MTGRSVLARYLRFSMLFAALFFLFSGCVASKPNLSIINENYSPPPGTRTDKNFSAARSILAEISTRNPQLAIELGKLPDLQDGISVQEKQALERLQRKYIDEPDSFESAFQEMYKIGLPEIRKYCSPLQALFWTALDNEHFSNSNLLVNYSLESLLGIAWKFDPLSYRLMSERQIKEVIDGIQIEYIRNQYLDDLQSGAGYAQLQHSLVADYKRSRRMNLETFSKKASRLIEVNLISGKHAPRWKDFWVVIDRLNAPELIDYYERSRFRYEHWYNLPEWPASPRYVFNYNKGDCASITGFTVLCLTRSGYKAWEHRGRTAAAGVMHSACVFEMNGKKYVMDNGKQVPSGIVPWEFYNRIMR